MNVLTVGGILVAALGTKTVLKQLDLPDFLGYLVIGVLVGMVDGPAGLLPMETVRLLHFLADFGLIALLFRIGLNCNPNLLLDRLAGAARLWALTFLACGGLGFAAAFLLVGWDWVSSLFVGLALTTTSIGVSVRTWRRVERLDSPEGALLLDTAELDDLSGVLVLAVLTALAPRLSRDFSTNLVRPILEEVFQIATTVSLLFLGGILFAQYIEGPLTRYLRELQDRPDTTLIVLGIGLCVVGFTALLDIPFAVGGFFAGLLFSRNPLSVKVDASFDSLYDLFVPFFFVGIGRSIDLAAVPDLTPTAALLFLTAVVGKAVGLPVALRRMPALDAILLIVSLIPRSELALIIVDRGRALGFIPESVFLAVVLVVVATMIGVPLLLRILLRAP